MQRALYSVAQEAEQLLTHRRTAHVCVRATLKSLDRHQGCQVGILVRSSITASVIPVNLDGGRHLTLKRPQQHLHGSAWRSRYHTATTQTQVLTHGGRPERQGRWVRPHRRSMQGCYLWQGNSTLYRPDLQEMSRHMLAAATLVAGNPCRLWIDGGDGGEPTTRRQRLKQ